MRFYDVLKYMLDGASNIGTKYKQGNDDIFTNKYLERLQTKFKGLGAKIDLNLKPNQQRQLLDKYNFDNVFSEETGYLEFYKQAKQGKIFTDDQKRKKIMFQFFEQIQLYKELPMPLFNKKPTANI